MRKIVNCIAKYSFYPSSTLEVSTKMEIDILSMNIDVVEQDS